MTADDEIEHLKSRVRELEGVLSSKNKTVEAAFHLPPAMSKLLSLLLALPIITSEMVVGRLQIATNAKVAIWRLRQELQHWDIEIQSKRGVGWWLDETAKARVKDVIAGKVTRKVSDVAA